jgi:pyridoxal phosphate enzyme (YggS family)
MGPTAEERGIWDRLERVRRRVEGACQRSGRTIGQVRLVAVTKGRSLEVIRSAYQAGARDFGENRLEEALPKIEALQDLQEVRWHMIGHVQSRKAQGVIGQFFLIHSVDRLKLARRLDRSAGAAKVRVRSLLECNMSGEASKEGWDLSGPEAWSAAGSELIQVAGLPGLEVLGLMTMAPLVDDPEAVRPVFRRLAELAKQLACSETGSWTELSMGMTDDFEVAIEEGATMVRIGRAIFGESG